MMSMQTEFEVSAKLKLSNARKHRIYYMHPYLQEFKQDNMHVCEHVYEAHMQTYMWMTSMQTEFEVSAKLKLSNSRKHRIYYIHPYLQEFKQR